MARSDLNDIIWSSRDSGSALIQVVVAAAIMAIVMANLAGMLLYQTREIKALEQKQEIMDLKNILLQNFSTLACTNQLVNLSFQQTAALSDVVLDLPGAGGSELRITEDGTGLPIAKVGQNLPGSQTQLSVSGIKFKDLEQIGSSDEFKGALEIQFDGSTTLRALKPLKISKVVFAPITSGTTRKILNCLSTVSEPTTIAQNTKTYTPAELGPLVTTFNCYGGCNNQNVRTYQVPIGARTRDQYLSINAVGVWDVTACASGPGCAITTKIKITLGGVDIYCGANSTYGSSGPYTSIISSGVSCIQKVPANSPALITFIFDGRGGQTFNANPGTYNDSSMQHTPVISFYSIN